MFWAGIMESDLIGHFRVLNGVKVNSLIYNLFLKEVKLFFRYSEFIENIFKLAE